MQMDAELDASAGSTVDDMSAVTSDVHDDATKVGDTAGGASIAASVSVIATAGEDLSFDGMESAQEDGLVSLPRSSILRRTRSVVRPFIMRRLKSHVLKDLPKKVG